MYAQENFTQEDKIQVNMPAGWLDVDSSAFVKGQDSLALLSSIALILMLGNYATHTESSQVNVRGFFNFGYGGKSIIDFLRIVFLGGQRGQIKFSGKKMGIIILLMILAWSTLFLTIWRFIYDGNRDFMSMADVVPVDEDIVIPS